MCLCLCLCLCVFVLVLACACVCLPQPVLSCMGVSDGWEEKGVISVSVRAERQQQQQQQQHVGVVQEGVTVMEWFALALQAAAADPSGQTHLAVG